jgi:signal transduction histidine kinase
LGALVFLLQMALIFKLLVEEKKRKRSEKATRELAGRLIRAQEEERRRIARELHDDLSQRLSLLCLKLDTLRASPPESSEILTQELTVLYDETDVLSSDVHQFSHKLHPAILEKLGLIAALRRYCSEFSAHRKIAVDMQVSGEEPFLQDETALALFRVGQECLMNVAKHSGAVSCELRVDYTRDRVILEVRDKGSGFEPQNLRGKVGLGLESMRERLRSLGGTLLVESARSRGTRVRAEAPILPAPADGVSRESENTAVEPSNVSAL